MIDSDIDLFRRERSCLRGENLQMAEKKVTEVYSKILLAIDCQATTRPWSTRGNLPTLLNIYRNYMYINCQFYFIENAIVYNIKIVGKTN